MTKLLRDTARVSRFLGGYIELACHTLWLATRQPLLSVVGLRFSRFRCLAAVLGGRVRLQE